MSEKDGIKARVFDHLITTTIGIVFLLLGFFMIYMKVRCWVKPDLVCDFTWVEAISISALGGTYIVAKDTLVTQGILGGVLKLFNKK